MSKELEALESFSWILSEKSKYKYINSELEKYEIVKKALQRLEKINNAKPSEALKCLENIGKLCYIEADNLDESVFMYANQCQGFDTIKNYILKAQEMEKEIAKYEMLKKALKEGIYVKDLPNENKLKYIPTLTLSNIGTEWYLSNHCDMCVNVRDYKTLFWLKKDKSE